MSYEYKEMLKAAARDFLDGTIQQDFETGEYLNLGEVEEIYSDISIELDRVYTQADKADEYEAKAKAFDEIMKVYENNFGAADSLAKLKVFTEVENAYIESGESDA